MPNCSFCNKPISIGTGVMFVDKSGKVLYFDKRKCEKYMLKLNRKSRDYKWAEKSKVIKK